MTILLPTQTYADISTAHITEADAKALKEMVEHWNPALIVYELAEYGWLIYVSQFPLLNANISPELQHLLEAARAQGCTFLRLDRDGPVIDGLPTFEW